MIFSKPTLRTNGHEIINRPIFITSRHYFRDELAIIGVDSLCILLRQSTSTFIYLSHQYKKYLLVLVCLVANWRFCGWLDIILF